MPSPLGAFYRSPLGAFLRSPLGMRGVATPDEEENPDLEPSGNLRTKYNVGGIPGDWVSIFWDTVGVFTRSGASPVACYPGMAKLFQRFLKNSQHTPGIRLAGIKEDAEDNFVRTTADTYASRQWEIVPTTSFPAWPPSAWDEDLDLYQANVFGDEFEIFISIHWDVSITYSEANPRPRGYLIYIEPDDDDPDGTPWYPIATCSPGIPGLSEDSPTLIRAQISMRFTAGS